MNEFGQADTNYDGPTSLIVAVHNYPTRFSPETHALVAELIAKELSMPTQVTPDSIQ